MKILAIVDSWSSLVYFAGARAIYRLNREVANLGVEMHLLCALQNPTGDFGKKMLFQNKNKKIFLHFYDMRWIFLRRGTLYLLVTRFFCFIKAIRLERIYRFDIIHDYSSTPLMFFFDGLFSLWGKKIVHTLTTTSGLNLFEKPIFWSGLKFIDKLIITSSYFSKKVSHYDQSEDKVDYISLGVGKEYLDVSKRKGGKKTKISYIGPDEERKGSDLFFALTEKTKGFDFLWVTAKKTKPPPQVEVLEGVFEITKVLSLCDIVVFPYRTLEGILFEPQTLLEAMASGKAIVVADFPQIRDIAKDSVLYFSPGNLNDFIHKVSFLAQSEKVQSELGQKARKIIENQYDVTTSAKKLLGVYKELND